MALTWQVVSLLKVLAQRCPELEWEQLLRPDLLPTLSAPSPNRGSTLPTIGGFDVVGKHVEFW